jgi:formylmethanofuran dehydrogenase subunit B
VKGNQVFRSVACLGCGCGCDDLEVRVLGDRIEAVSPPCPVAVQWFGDGIVPAEIRVDGAPASLEQAIESAAALLGSAARPMVLVTPGLTTQAQRTAIALADVLRAELDGATSEPAAAGLLAAQRRGRPGGTLGEIRNRADVVLFWAVDPAERYPRYLERYAAAASATHAGRRTLLSVSVGPDRGPPQADLSAAFTPEQEIDALAVMRAVVRGQQLDDLPEALRPAVTLAERLLRGSYVALVHDAEPGPNPRDDQRSENLAALAQLLNGPTRAVLSSLRAGGNRTGAEAALTWQTGYPMRVSFREGHPQYRPGRSGAERLRAGRTDALLVAGSAAGLGEDALPAGGTLAVVVGPGASRFTRAHVAIDTGVAGIHESGIGYRMDEVPLPLTSVLIHPRPATETLALLLQAVRARAAGRAG